MLTIPNNGWTNLQIDEFSDRASYLTDVPNDCLDAFIHSMQNNKPAVIFFDAEGWDFHLVTSHYRSYIIIAKDDVKIYEIKKNLLELAKELHEDINNNIDNWVIWDMNEDETNAGKLESKQKLVSKLSQLNVEITKRM